MALKVNTKLITWKALSLFCFAFQKKIYVNGFDWELITLSKVIKIINKISGCSLPRKVPKAAVLKLGVATLLRVAKYYFRVAKVYHIGLLP
jgi:hypothetical protein